MTIPFKEEAAHLADADEKAVNTLVRVSGPGAPARFRSANTDRIAFEQVVPERSRKKPGTGPALVLGAGGTARVAVEVLLRKGWEVLVVNRTEERGEELARETGAIFLSKKSPATWPEPQLVVNATALGLREGDADSLPAGVPPPRRARDRRALSSGRDGPRPRRIRSGRRRRGRPDAAAAAGRRSGDAVHGRRDASRGPARPARAPRCRSSFTAAWKSRLAATAEGVA